MQTVNPPYAGSWEVPDGVTVAWGARLIIRQDGYVDFVWDRQGATEADPAEWTRLADWIDGGAMNNAKRSLCALLTAYRLTTREDTDVVLYDDGKGIIRGNPRRSAGYCYVVAYLIPTEEDA